MDDQSLNHILAPLKPFQRRTVDLAFKRLFESEDTSYRFLVADEAGLGKTMVARGVIAKTIHHLQDCVERIDIVYICSNTRIATSNLPKLRLGKETSNLLATRLTLLVQQTAKTSQESTSNLAQNKVNLVSFTPGTSINLRSQGGIVEERLILFHLLKEHFHSTTGLSNFLQCGVGNHRWMELLKKECTLDERIEKSFLTAYEQDDLQDQVAEFIATYGEEADSWPVEVRRERLNFVGRVRELLASVSVEALQPNLIILDEFQRFRDLLNPEIKDATTKLAQKIFTSKTADGSEVRILLLSATPYRYYASNAELASEDHYEDFLKTTEFLFNHDPSEVADLKRNFTEYWKAINTSGEAFNENTVLSTKQCIESRLLKVMSRTERGRATESGDAMVLERKHILTIKPNDVIQYRCTDALFNEVCDTDPMQYWKSASYITQFMYGYKFDDRLRDLLDYRTGSKPEEFLKLLRANKANILRRSDIEQWKKIDPGNAKIRDLMSEFFDCGWEKLLWVPPTVPYWQLEGPFKGMENQTKALLFSAWNVVPDVVSGLLSYEAERRMVRTTHFDRNLNYERLSQLSSTPLRLDGDPNPKTSHRQFALLLPCVTLANIHPLRAIKINKNPKTWVRSQVTELLKGLPNPSTGKIDRRWEWATLVLLDPGLKTLLSDWKSLNLPLSDSKHLDGYLKDFLNIESKDLGRRPKGLLNLLTDFALGSPAIVAARSFITHEDSKEGELRRRAGAQIAGAFWQLFNRPAVTYLLRNLYKRSTGREKTYWRLVLRYCRQGNLQAVLDEHWHWLWEQKSWDETKTRKESVNECVISIKDAVVPNPSRVHVRCFDQLIKSKNGNVDGLRLRTVFALRYGKNNWKEKGRKLTDDLVRNAFNSPFRPFVLASTSIGQEGLDFHPWCHRVVHWDLPSNPIDFEQREGRVRRYKGHAVRRNVASKWKKDALALWDENTDFWSLMFKFANDDARELNRSDMVPCWVVDGECRVEQRIPLLPYTREESWYRQLKYQLAAYRVVLGQSRQEEFLQWLAESNITSEQLKSWSINLEPPST
ncbi:MAG: helicase [Gammaproteobacteria bacterium]|nr:helicase [Gammaproteobacteria bacterium]MYF01622.1 helicase [Gammaproteobacteria bacterium]MYI77519.1 helicase [Gammaproteobacteria bacterium]